MLYNKFLNLIKIIVLTRVNKFKNKLELSGALKSENVDIIFMFYILKKLKEALSQSPSVMFVKKLLVVD